MFAVVVPGRPVQAVTQVPETPDRFVAILPEAHLLNHITVFMDGTVPFPDGWGCTIHLDVPGKGWSLIGALSNAKPSAIFRLRGKFIPSDQSQASGFSTAASQLASSHLSATLGILCEPLVNIEQQLAALGPGNTAEVGEGAVVLASSTSPKVTSDPVLVAQRVAMNLFNHVSGFVQPLPGGTGTWVDFSVMEKWYSNFERKLKTGGVGFLLQND